MGLFRTFGLVLVLMLWTNISDCSLHEDILYANKAGNSLNFLVVGDWGRKGLYNQSQVAVQMGRIGEKLDIDFVISTGDNFYENGLTGTEDPSFDQSFSEIYTAKSLQTQWYSVLGNHDYRGDALAQLSPTLRNRDPRWYCQRSFILKYSLQPMFRDFGWVDFFFVDTTPFVDKYWVPSEESYDWRGIIPRENYIKQQLQAYGVDVYMNGHDHCLEHITNLNSPLEFLTSGGGSKAWRGISRSADMKGLQFFHDGQGFMSVKITPTLLHVTFYDVDGKPIHHLDLLKNQNLSY